jgi:exonuclease III
MSSQPIGHAASAGGSVVDSRMRPPPPSSSSFVPSPQQRRIQQLKIGSWNVRTAMSHKKRSEIGAVLERARIDICAVQEARISGCGSIDIPKFSLFFSGNDRGRAGVGVFVSSDLCHTVVNWLPCCRFPDRIATLICDEFAVIVVYCFTESGSSLAEKEGLAEALNDTIKSCSRRKPVFICGDFNCRLGEADGISIGAHGMPREVRPNDNGSLIKEIAASLGYVFLSTFFKHSEAKKWTWRSHGRRSRNYTACLDHILCSRRFKNMFTNCVTWGGISRLSDHKILIAEFKFSFPLFRRDKKPHSNSLVIWSPERESHCLSRIGQDPPQPPATDDADEMWQYAKTYAQRILENSPTEHPNFPLGEEYGFDYDLWWQRRCESIEQQFRRHNLRAAYNLLKSTYTRKKSPPVDVEAVMSQLASHSEVDTVQEFTITTVPNEIDALNRVPEIQETHEACMKLKRNKCPGEDNIPAEFWKIPEAIELLHQVVVCTWNSRSMPADWRRASLHPLSKKTGGYRGISLLATGYKVYALILLSRIYPFVESFVGSTQNGFLRSRSTAGSLAVANSIAERVSEYNYPLQYLSVDFEKAFDKASRSVIHQLLIDAGVDWRVADRLKDMLSNTVTWVEKSGAKSSERSIRNGIRQGCPCSPVLFLPLLAFLWRQVEHRMKEQGLLNHLVARTEFADDSLSFFLAGAALFAKQEMSSLGPALGLFVNDAKTVIGTICRNGPGFDHLGSVVGNVTNAIKARLSKAWQSYYALSHKIWKFSSITLNTKCRVFQTICIPVLLYGLAHLPVSAAKAHALDSFAYKCARRLLKVYGAVHLSYAEVESRFASAGCEWLWPSRLLAVAQFRAFGHAARHHLFELSWVPPCNRPRGRPPKRFHEIISSHAGLRGFDRESLLLMAQDRDGWREVAATLL